MTTRRPGLCDRGTSRVWPASEGNRMKLKPLNEQVAVVFGATSGIGRATALEFARRGAKVVAAARGQEGLASLAEEIRQSGGEVTVGTADAASFEQVKAVADLAATTHGRIDTWIHVAAVTLYARFEDTTPEEFRQIIDVNLLGQIHGALAALPHLRNAGGGALIHVSSVEATISLPFQAAYAASKHGMVGFMDALRMELKQEGIPISVTNIRPSSINTPLFDKARTRLGVKPKGAPPIYQPRTVANAILYAAEHSARDIVVGGAGKMLTLSHRFMPRLTDALLAPYAWRSQLTDEPKSADAPDNLEAPLPGNHRVEGPFTHQSFSRSLYTWFATHPVAKWAMTGVLLLAIASIVVATR